MQTYSYVNINDCTPDAFSIYLSFCNSAPDIVPLVLAPRWIEALFSPCSFSWELKPLISLSYSLHIRAISFFISLTDNSGLRLICLLAACSSQYMTCLVLYSKKFKFPFLKTLRTCLWSPCHCTLTPERDGVTRFFASGFFMNQFPPAPEYPIRTVSKSRCTTSINDTGGIGGPVLKPYVWVDYILPVRGLRIWLLISFSR